MPTLLQINVDNNLFSAGKIVNDIGDVVLDGGWESYIAYGRDYAPGRSTPIRIGTRFDQLLHGIETRIFDNHCLGFSSGRATKKLIERIEEIRPDVIQIFVLPGYYINMRVLFNYLSKKDIPVVFTVCSCWEFTGHCTHYTYEKCDKWKIECHDCPLKNEYPQSYIFDRSRKNFREKKALFHSIKNLTLTVPSVWLRDQMKESFLSDIRTEVINFGVDVNVYNPTKNIY